MISVSISLTTLVVYVTNINCILSSLNGICLGYKAIINKWIGMACGAETVTITKHFVSYDKG